jgi:ATP-dependent DNA helicase RecQ
VAKGLLRVDVSGYGALQLTEACAPVLRGEQSVEFRRDPAPKTTSTTKKASRDDFAGSPADQALYEALRQRRTELARDQEVPPYVIFHDATLRAMAEHRPTTPAAFGQISGVGAVKLERYGEAFMDVIRAAE